MKNLSLNNVKNLKWESKEDEKGGKMLQPMTDCVYIWL